MARRNDDNETPRLVWRITAEAPLGEYVDPRVADARKRMQAAHEAEEGHELGWLGSSLELLGGVGVSETPMDTLPGELIDEFFKPPRTGR